MMFYYSLLVRLLADRSSSNNNLKKFKLHLHLPLAKSKIKESLGRTSKISKESFSCSTVIKKLLYALQSPQAHPLRNSFSAISAQVLHGAFPVVR